MLHFKKHKGHRCPVADTEVVIVRFRGGFVAKQPLAASKYRWEQWPEGPHDFDIEAYTLVTDSGSGVQTWTAVSGGYS